MGNEINNKQLCTNALKELAQKKSYLTMDDVINGSDIYDLSMFDIDEVYDEIIGCGIILKDNNSQIDDDDEYSRTRIDYEEIFDKVIKIDKDTTNYINNIRQIPQAQFREEINIIYQAKDGNKYARDRIITMHLKVVVKIALWYYEKYGYPISDAIQDGNIGLITALEKMPMTGSYKFSTYAPWYIRRNISQRTYDSCYLIRTPIHNRNKLVIVNKIMNTHKCESCNTISYCDEMINEICNSVDCDKETALTFIEMANIVFNINKIGLKEKLLLSDNINYEMEIVNKITNQGLNKIFSSLFKALNEKEQNIIKGRFGFNTGEEQTLEQLGEIYGVTRERIRQIETRILKGLRNVDDISILRRYML